MFVVLKESRTVRKCKSFGLFFFYEKGNVMERKIVVLLVAIMLCLSGCANAEGATIEEEKDYSVHYTSEVSEDECCICGENDRSMMGYYRKSGMIGLVCLNTMSISSLDVRPYSNDGTEIIDNSSGTMLTSHGENECSFHISGMPGRGILEAEVNYGEESTPDFKKISEFLCQNCLSKVAEMYEEEMNWSDGEGRFPEVCLVDFATNELYTLGEHRLGYWIRDFWVHIDHKEEQSDIMVIYAPEDKMEGYNYASEDIE